jgi:hypothetical protein
MHQTRTYWRPNYTKFAQYFGVFALLILSAQHFRHEVFGCDIFGVGSKSPKNENICQSEENRANKGNRNKRGDRNKRRRVAKDERTSQTVELSAASNQFISFYQNKGNEYGKEKNKTAPVATFESKESNVKNTGHKSSKKGIGNIKHKNGTWLCDIGTQRILSD